MSRRVAWVLVHDLGRSGVPLSLVRLCRWLADSPESADLDVHVLARRDGPVRADLEPLVSSVLALDPPHRRSAPSTVAVGLAQAGRADWAGQVRSRAWRRQTRALPPPDVVVLHGAGAWQTHDDLRPHLPTGTRTVVHVHELELALDRCIPAERQAEVLGRADAVLAVCDAVARMAIERGADPARVQVVSGTADAVAAPLASGPPEVVAIGDPSWRKGVDRFVALAHELGRTHPSVRCRWIGGQRSPSAEWAVGAELPLCWTPARPEPWADVTAGSVLVVPSREDPLPLVVLEAGLRGVPVVAAATGGLPDLLADDRGLVVPGHDLAGLAAAVGSCLEDPVSAGVRGVGLAENVRTHHAVGVVGPRWLTALGGPGRFSAGS